MRAKPITWINFKTPQMWTLNLNLEPNKDIAGHYIRHLRIGVVSYNIESAIEMTRQKYPDAAVLGVSHQGPVHIISEDVSIGIQDSE